MSPALTPILFALAGAVVLSVNDMGVKLLSGGYALHQIILFRTLGAMVVVALVIAASGTGYGQIRTRRPLAHLVRVGLILLSNFTFFMGLAAMPLAEGVALGFVAPLLVTIMSALFLKEPVGPRRWAAVVVGLIGVLIVYRPGVAVVQLPALLVLAGAAFYAGAHIMTRVMRQTESTIALSSWVLVGFLTVSALMGLIAGDGRFAGQADPSVEFLLRAWVWPQAGDWPVLALLGVAMAGGGLMITQAYRTGPPR